MKQLVNEYASSLNLLFVKMGEGDIELYKNKFLSIFQNFFYVAAENEINEIWDKYKDSIDLIIINIDNKIEKDKLEQKLTSFRKFNILIPVYVIYSDVETVSTYNIISNCFFDTIIPYPYNEERINQFFYSSLKRVIEINELNFLIEDLESNIDSKIENSTDTNAFKIESILESLKNPSPVIATNSFDEKDIREKDLRFTQTDKISADDFVGTLDITFIDKVEIVQDHLDNFITILYDFEERDSADAYLLLPSIVEGIQEVYILINSIGSFSIVARAFDSLRTFLENLSEENLAQNEQKQMLSKMLISIALDLENWIKVVFIEHTTDNIHYFDASFSSNILEIENVFTVQEACEEEDFEFF